MLLHLKMLQGVMALEVAYALCNGWIYSLPYAMDGIIHYSMQLFYTSSISHTLRNELGPYPMESLHTLWNDPIPYKNPYTQSRSPFVSYLGICITDFKRARELAVYTTRELES